MTRGPLVAVVGPTATGKSELARRAGRAARRRGGQRRLDAALPRHGHRHREARRRPSAAVSRTTCSTSGTVTERASVAEYQRLARAAVDDVLARGRLPVLVGGSGLYVRAVLDELRLSRHRPGRCGPGWRPSWPRSGRPPCTRDCRRVDPEAARGDPAVERAPGGPRAGGPRADRAAVRAPRCRAPAAGRTTRCQIGLDRPGDLDERVAARVDRMWAAGPGRRGARAGRARPAGRSDGEPGARLPAGARLPRRALRRGDRTGGDGPGHPPVRPAAARPGSAGTGGSAWLDAARPDLGGAAADLVRRTLGR